MIREFQSPNEEMKKIVLKVMKQCVSIEEAKIDCNRNDIFFEFLKNLLNQKNYRNKVMFYNISQEIF